MTIKPIRTVNSYELPDGRIFRHRREAEYEQAKADLDTLMRSTVKDVLMDGVDFASVIIDHDEQFAAATEKLLRTRLRWEEQSNAGLSDAVAQERADADTLHAELVALAIEPMAKEPA